MSIASASSFSGKRKENVIARLNAGYTVDDIKEAILGAKIDAFVAPNGERKDDLELICRHPEKLDSFRARYDAWERQHPEAQEERVAHPSSTYVPELALAAENVVLHEENERLRRLLEQEERIVRRASELLSQEPALLAKLLNRTRGATVTDIASRRVA